MFFDVSVVGDITDISVQNLFVCLWFAFGMHKNLTFPSFQTVSRPGERLESSRVRRNNELNLEEEVAPLVALAPDASLPEEQSTATTDTQACPLFQHLDEVWPI